MKKASSFKMEGISQADRYPDSLRTDYFRLEERDMDDFLFFALKLSRQFKYYNQDDKVDGTWEDFFLKDPNVLARFIAKHQISGHIRFYDRLFNSLKQYAEKEGKRELIITTLWE